MDEAIGAGLGAEYMAKYLERAMMLVLLRIEEAFAISGPAGAAGGIVDLICEVFTRRQIPDADSEEFLALVVGRPGAEAVVGRDGKAAEIEERLRAGLPRAVDEDLLRA